MVRRVLVALVLLGVVVSWLVVLPRVTLVRMALAIEARDHEAVSRYIDFPRLRESLREELVEMMRARAEGDRRAAVGAAVGEAMVGPLVDRMVTPEGVRDLMRGGDALARMIPRDALPESGSGSGPPDFRIRSRGLRQVHVVSETPAGEFRLVFERRFPSMRLVGVRLPR